jgi:glycosyltransferase involved in cell wall biosynthesis
MSQITNNTKNKFFINKNKIIPMGIRDEFFNLSNENKEYSKNKFLYIGRLVDYKGIEILIESMKLLQDKKYNFNLDILGSGVDEDLLKEKVKNYGLSKKVVFQGFKNLSQKIEYYKDADVTFIPSLISKDRLEGGPLTVIEAMSQKSICIVSDSIGFINYLNDKNCIIFKSGNIESLSEVINIWK